MKNVSIQEVEKPVCAVTFCPRPGFETLLASASYKLDEKTNVRTGQIRVDNVNSDGSFSLMSLMNCGGILDVRWLDFTTYTPTLLSVGSDGFLRILQLNLQTSGLDSESVACTDTQHPLALFSGVSLNRIVTGHSDGFVTVASFAPSGLSLDCNWTAHEYEVWTTVFDASDDRIVYSGGDDSLLKLWDVRSRACEQRCKSFGAGVCHISPSPSDSMLLAVGSYDECVRLFDKRSLSRPISEMRLGDGGVWRVEWDATGSRLLCAVMQAGLALVHLEKRAFCEAVDWYTLYGTERLVYGAAWASTLPYVVSCSFYDRQVHVCSLHE